MIIIKDFTHNISFDKKNPSKNQQLFFDKYSGKAYDKLTYIGKFINNKEHALTVIAYIGFDKLWVEVLPVHLNFRDYKYQKVITIIRNNIVKYKGDVEVLNSPNNRLSWDFEIVSGGQYIFYKHIYDIPFGVYNLLKLGKQNLILQELNNFISYGCSFTNINWFMEPYHSSFKIADIKAFYSLKKEIKLEQDSKSRLRYHDLTSKPISKSKLMTTNPELFIANYAQWRLQQDEALEEFPT